MDTKAKLAALRSVMAQLKIDAYLIPSNDPHQSEYVAPHWQSRTWMSGFTGSYGVLIITMHKADLWTDSRYFIQAEQELKDSGIAMKKLEAGKPDYNHWLINNLKNGDTLGVDGQLLSKDQYQRLRKKLAPANIHINYKHDLIKEIWADRPTLPDDLIYEHAHPYPALSRMEKIDLVRQEMQALRVNAYPITKLDDIAWLLNLRGQDVDFNPVFIAYFLLFEKEAYLFIHPEKVPALIRESLEADSIKIKAYHDFQAYFGFLQKPTKVLIEPTLSIPYFNQIDASCCIYHQGLVESLKAIKHPKELDFIRSTMIKDGVALTRFYKWLDEKEDITELNEYQLSEQLNAFRAQDESYVGESFPAIVGFQSNAAVVHYRPQQEHSKTLETLGMLLVDSGGQYQSGTTDITRTITIGTPTTEQKETFTQVLKGHIELAMIQFPTGTTAGQLDLLARKHLWQSGRNYGHGTGHGVGYFLNVHEGPASISPAVNSARGRQILQVGMILSNEPGYYKPGEYGIRTENLICVQASAHEGFLKMETLSLFPIDQRLIAIDLMTRAEIQWLNSYHQQVFNRLSPHLSAEEQTWLREKCLAFELD